MAAKSVGGLAGFVLRSWKERGGYAPLRTLRMVESLALGGRKQVHLVACGERMFLVGVGADAVQCIVPAGSAADADPVSG